MISAARQSSCQRMGLVFCIFITVSCCSWFSGGIQPPVDFLQVLVDALDSGVQPLSIHLLAVSLLSRLAPRAGLVTLRQTFVRRCQWRLRLRRWPRARFLVLV